MLENWFRPKDGNVRIYPPTGVRQREAEEIKDKIADRCLNMLSEKGVLSAPQFMIAGLRRWP